MLPFLLPPSKKSPPVFGGGWPFVRRGGFRVLGWDASRRRQATGPNSRPLGRARVRAVPAHGVAHDADRLMLTHQKECGRLARAHHGSRPTSLVRRRATMMQGLRFHARSAVTRGGGRRWGRAARPAWPESARDRGRPRRRI